MPVRPIRAGGSWLAASVATVALAGCSPANQLQGSLSQLTSLSFTSVEVALQITPPLLVVTYKEAVGAGFDVPFELSLEVTKPPLTQGTVFQLGGADSSGNAVATATRSVTGDSRVFPAIKMGTVTIDQEITVNKQGAGHFFLVFDYQNDSSLGQGQTVEGSFQAVVTQS